MHSGERPRRTGMAVAVQRQSQLGTVAVMRARTPYRRQEINMNESYVPATDRRRPHVQINIVRWAAISHTRIAQYHHSCRPYHLLLLTTVFNQSVFYYWRYLIISDVHYAKLHTIYNTGTQRIGLCLCRAIPRRLLGEGATKDEWYSQHLVVALTLSLCHSVTTAIT